MPRREWRLRIEDILNSIQRIDDYLQDMDFVAFSADRRTVDAVLRNLEIIGEAAHHVPPDVRRRHPQVPWPVMHGIRNRLAHVYFEVDLVVIWDTSTQDLRPLIPLLEQLLNEESSQSEADESGLERSTEEIT